MSDERIICTVHELNGCEWECFRPSESGGNSPAYCEDKPDMEFVAYVAKKRHVDLGVAFAMVYGNNTFDKKTENKAISDYYKSIGVMSDD